MARPSDLIFRKSNFKCLFFSPNFSKSGEKALLAELLALCYDMATGIRWPASSEIKEGGIKMPESFSFKDVALEILHDAEESLQFRGGRVPAMTLETDSNDFYPVSSKDVDAFLIDFLYHEKGIIANRDLRQMIIDGFMSFAMKASLQEPAYRIAQHKKTIYYRLSERKLLRISAKGVKPIEYAKGVAFWADASDRPQAQPDLSVKPRKLLPLLRKAFRVNSEYELIFAANLVAFFCPNLRTPILVLSGEKGTAKTTTSRHIMDLVAPSSVQQVVSLPSREDALIAQITNAYMTAFDNVQFPISPRFSDILCQLVTHGSYCKRSLYSTNGKAVFALRGKLIMNGIDEIAARPDFAERCNVVYLDVITSAERRCDSEIEAEFEAIKPKVLGAIINTIAAVLADTKDYSAFAKPRMAEFAQFGLKVMTAIGAEPSSFLQQYQHGIEEQIADAEARSPIVRVIDKLLFQKTGQHVRETPTIIATQVNRIASQSGIPLTEQTANSITKTLKKSVSALKASGIILTLPVTRQNERWIELRKVGESAPTREHHPLPVVDELDNNLDDL